MGKNKKKKPSKPKEQATPVSPTPRHSHQQDENGRQATGPNAAAPASSSRMDCDVCKERFDGGRRKPRNLACGHSFCSVCCQAMLDKEHVIICPKCRRKTPCVGKVDELPVNYPVLEVLKDTGSNTTGAAAQKGERGPSRDTGRNSAPQGRGKTSPHGGKCLESQAEVAMHCAHCRMWLCEACSRIDHSSPECLLTPHQETLKEMGQAGRAKARTAVNDLEEFTGKVKNYSNQLKSCAAILQVTLDCVKKQEGDLPRFVTHSNKIEQDLRETGANRIPTDIEDALCFLDGLDEATSAAQQWAADASTTVLKTDQVSRLSRTLLQTAVQMHTAIPGPHAAGSVLGLHHINNVELTLPVEMDGSRLLVNAARLRPPDPGSRVVKLEHIKSCIDPSCALTFLDISSKGRKLGRVFIRLLGSSKRSLCFLMMCTGEAGPSFQGTRFHRVWWVGQRGEHIWAGDHDCGDGSGGAIPKAILDQTKELSDEKTQVLITSGLVAGRYGKNNSTIFRVYTKESSDVMEEFALGRVEYGLQIIQDAVKMHNNIGDVTISGCGVVVES